jgi:von Willebrand factor type A domain
VRSLLLSVVLLLCAAAPAHAGYDQALGGTASPSALTAGGQTGYSVSLKGRPAVVDVVFVLDNSGSMSDNLPSGGTKWTNLSDRTKSFVDALAASGLFSRGGRIGVVLFSTTATTAATPTTDVAAIKSGIASGAPDAGSCISCGIQSATDLLTSIPGASSHRQIVYLAADGTDDGTPPVLADTVAAANAAHIERRVMGIALTTPPPPSPGLESIDSDGVVAYPATGVAIGQAYAAEPTAYPGATNLSWTFHVAPGFNASSATASQGSASVTGQDVTWTLPSLGDETATLNFQATHDITSGCGATSLLTGTGFSDAEGDAAPGAGLGALTVTGCPTPPPPTGGPGPTAALLTPVTLSAARLSATRFTLGTAAPTIDATPTKANTGAALTFTLDRAARITVRFDHVLRGRRSGTRCVTQTSANRKHAACTRYTSAGTITRDVTAGRHQLRFAGRLDAGRRLTAGVYRLTLVVTGSAGGPSIAKTLTLTALNRH